MIRGAPIAGWMAARYEDCWGSLCSIRLIGLGYPPVWGTRDHT